MACTGFTLAMPRLPSLARFSCISGISGPDGPEMRPGFRRAGVFPRPGKGEGTPQLTGSLAQARPRARLKSMAGRWDRACEHSSKGQLRRDLHRHTDSTKLPGLRSSTMVGGPFSCPEIVPNRIITDDKSKRAGALLEATLRFQKLFLTEVAVPFVSM